MCDDDFESFDNSGIKAVNVSYKNKPRPRLSPLLYRRKVSNQNSSASGHENEGSDNRSFPTSRLSPSLGRRSPMLSPRSICGCNSMNENNDGLSERNISKCPDCGRERGIRNSAINADWNDPLLRQNAGSKLYTSEGELKRISYAGYGREPRGFDDMQILDVEDQPSPVDYISIESKARLPKIIVTDMNKRSSQNVSSSTEMATPVKLPPISPVASSPRTSSASTFEMYRTHENQQGDDAVKPE